MSHEASIYNDPLFWQFPVGGTLVSMGAFMLFALPLTWLAWRDPESLRKYRVQLRRPRAQDLLAASLWRWLANNALLFALTAAAWPLLRLTRIHAGPRPPAWLIAVQVLFFVYLDDFLYYWMHRTLHRGWLYKKIHSVHHRILTPWAITGHFMHPVEYVLTGALMLAGPVLLGVHVFTLWIWIAVRQWEAAEGHCGYDLPWTPTHLLPLNDGAVHHDFHHARVKGNYAGFLRYLDGVFKTYARGYEDDRRRRARGER